MTWAHFVRDKAPDGQTPPGKWELLSMTDHDEFASEWEDEAAEPEEVPREYAIVPIDDFIVQPDP